MLDGFYLTKALIYQRYCSIVNYIPPCLPPVTKKYDSMTIANTTIADGGLIHPGFLSFKFGSSRTWKGKLKIASIFETTKGKST